MTQARAIIPLTSVQLAQVSDLAVAAAVTHLTHQGQATPATVAQLTEMALTKADTDVDLADHWLAVAEGVSAQLGSDVAGQATIAYARARIHVHRGELTVAEAVLRQAQTLWQSVGDSVSYRRSLLGLTQILAMQGRYDEAETAARQAIDHAINNANATYLSTDQSTNPEGGEFGALMGRVAAHHNLATLLLYQERHSEALAEHEQIRQLLTDPPAAESPEQQVELVSKLAHSHLNRATALTFLDQPQAAEEALQQAILLFTQTGDSVNLGRSRTNLGRIFLRTGQYAAALAIFEVAFHDLLGAQTTMAAAELEQLRVADELLLEYATACLAINLLPEAGLALARSEALFRSATQPYELGQTLYTQALLFLRTQQWKLAQGALDEATTLFAALQNGFWLNRTRLAQAAVAYARQQTPYASQLLDLLLAENNPSTTDAAGAVQWDVGGQVETRLLRLRIHVEQGELATARHQATLIAQILQAPAAKNGEENRVIAWPQFHLRLEHMLGKIALAASNYPRARSHLKAALQHLEQQRATLLIEEVRSAFVNDKSELYADLVQTLFAMARNQETTQETTDQTRGEITGDMTNEMAPEALMAEAFAVIEQSRSRVLLERLLAAFDPPSEPAATGVEEEETATQRQRLVSLRTQLHWLYNQFMGESGSRRLDTQISRQLQRTEAALQQAEWQHSPLLAQADAVDLPTFQAALTPDQQAIVYAAIHEEVFAFWVDRTDVKVYRRLTDLATVKAAAAELRFQMGRVEVDPAYVTRHSQRLTARVREALHQLHHLLVAPLADVITAKRLLFIPFGPLHRLSFHALWDGERYLIERAECSYAPSASLAVLCRTQHTAEGRLAWAGFAITDPAIPAAHAEVQQAARYFSDGFSYVDTAANRANLWQAAAQTDVLHLATHGLFRPDNPFFSALKLADGWLDVRELYRLPLAARLVVLSACESGIGDISGGDEVVGLARGFLGAGRASAGRALVATLWNVHDATAVQFMSDFYQQLTQAGPVRPAAALRAAQQQAIQRQQHPYYWAPFFVIGA